MPWENAKTERHGGFSKQVFEEADVLELCMNMTEVDFLADAVTTAKNRHSNRSGHSPAQRVLGESARMSASLLSDDFLDPDMMSTFPPAELRRAAALRLAVQTAMLRRTLRPRTSGARTVEGATS